MNRAFTRACGIAVLIIILGEAGAHDGLEPTFIETADAIEHHQVNAQCEPYWSTDFSGTGIDNQSRAAAVFDDGSGPALYVGGDFVSAGGETFNYIAKWDGSTWSSVGGGMNSGVRALIVHDDGSGPALFAGGSFSTAGGVNASRIAKWDGEMWHAVGEGVAGGSVLSLAIHEDAKGTALYVGGTFTSAGGQSANRIARWDGKQWSALGAGMDYSSGVVHVYALVSADLGTGSMLFAGGLFTSAGGIPANRVAGWDGSQWFNLDAQFSGGSGGSPSVWSLASFDDGYGSALYVGGNFNSVNGEPYQNIARWDGKDWSGVGGGLAGSNANSLLVSDFEGESHLYVAGWLWSAGGNPIQGAARWDGVEWTAMSGLAYGAYDLAVFDDGTGASLYGTGVTWNEMGEPTTLSMWDGQQWVGIYNGVHKGLNHSVSTLFGYDDGTGYKLYAGGLFTYAGELPAQRIARWDGATWEGVGEGMDGAVSRLVAFEGALYASGPFTTPATGIARWANGEWSDVGGGVNTSAGTMLVHNDGTGPALFVGGNFTIAGGIFANRIAKWDGQQWHALGSGLHHTSATPAALAMAVFDDGTGPALYVGGRFTHAGGTLVNHIARWDGTTWSSVGGGVTGSGPRISALAVYNDGNGPALYAGGFFNAAGGASAVGIAKWDGTQWSPLVDAMGNVISTSGISAFQVFDDGTGVRPWLIAGGSLGGLRIRKWNGTLWSPLGTGLSNSASAMTTFNDGTGPALFVGGLFDVAGGHSSRRIAKWTGCQTDWKPGDLNYDGSVDQSDVLLLLQSWGSCGDPALCPADLNGDGVVDVSDLLIMLNNWD